MNGTSTNISFKFVNQDQVCKKVKKLDGNKVSQKK